MWKKIVPSVYYYSNGIVEPNKKWGKVAMFDLDHTLIQPKSGKIHPNDVKDWRWCFPNVVNKLLNLIKEKYLIVIITNQAGLKTKEWLLTRMEIALEEIIGEYDPNNLIPIKVFVPFEDNIYRKPNSLIFEEFIYPTLTEDYTDLFYVGDMDGSDSNTDSDRKFAYNITMFLKFKNPDNDTHMKFYNPVEFFENEEIPRSAWQGFDPVEFYKTTEKISLQKFKDKIKNELDNENAKFIMLVGPPASGKSTLAKLIQSMIPNSYYVSRDKCKTRPSCIKYCQEYLPNTVILDNTNASISERAEYIAMAKEHKIPVYVFIMDHYNDIEKNKMLYKQLNIMRARMGKNKIPDVVYNVFYKNYQEPDAAEKIDKIIKLPFYPLFRSAEQKFRFYQRYI